MRKYRICCVIAYLIIAIPSFAVDLEQITYDAPKNPEYTISMAGYFIKPGVAIPDSIIFTYSSNNKKFPLAIFMLTEFKFLGRTGENTFDLEKTFNIVGGKWETKKLSIYLDKNTPLILDMHTHRLYTGCNKDDKIFLKMVNLKSNELEYQIVLPDCLKPPR